MRTSGPGTGTGSSTRSSSRRSLGTGTRPRPPPWMPIRVLHHASNLVSHPAPHPLVGHTKAVARCQPARLKWRAATWLSPGSTFQIGCSNRTLFCYTWLPHVHLCARTSWAALDMVRSQTDTARAVAWKGLPHFTFAALLHGTPCRFV